MINRSYSYFSTNSIQTTQLDINTDQISYLTSDIEIRIWQLSVAKIGLDLLRDSDGSATAALVALSGDDLVVVLASQVHSCVLPSIEVACYVDAAADRSSWVLLGVADGPELLEGLGTIDRGLVVASSLEDVVGSTVAGYRTLARGRRRRIVRAVGFDNVVLDERATSPTIDGEVAVSIGVVCTAIVDGPIVIVSVVAMKLMKECL
jgi:hypothetical protein